MKILSIDTATEACSAALYLDGEVTTQYQLAPREHSRLILSMIDQLLADVDVQMHSIDAIAFGRGPGSFMGLRIAAGVVQGIAFAQNIPVIPVSTLKAIAHRVFNETGNTHVLTAIDARMDEVYWAAYYRHNGQWQLEGEEQVISPERIQLPDMLQQKDASWTAAGTGWASYHERLFDGTRFKPALVLPDCFPSAEVIAQLAADEFASGNTVTASKAVPVYLRNDVAKKPKATTF